VQQKVKTGQAGIELMHQFEGRKLRPYLCPAHLWTIGYGHVLYQDQIKLPVVRKDGYTGIIRKEYPLAAKDNRAWTQEEVDRLFEDDLVSFERGVLRMSPNLAGSQSRFDAVVCFAFNCGVGNYQRSTIRMKNNRGDYEGAAEAFMMWTKGGGKELPGLVRRRKAEKALYLAG
jgi:lysozyme